MWYRIFSVQFAKEKEIIEESEKEIMTLGGKIEEVHGFCYLGEDCETGMETAGIARLAAT